MILSTETESEKPKPMCHDQKSGMVILKITRGPEGPEALT